MIDESKRTTLESEHEDRVNALVAKIKTLTSELEGLRIELATKKEWYTCSCEFTTNDRQEFARHECVKVTS